MEPPGAPHPDDVRAALAVLDARQRAIVGGLVAVLIQHPARVRDREWVAEQLTFLAVLAWEGGAAEGMEAVRRTHAYLARHARHLLEVAYQLYQRVGLDLADRLAEGVTHEDAMERVRDYLRGP